MGLGETIIWLDVHWIMSDTARLILFPVRHHSPACALALRQLANEVKPDVVLIEGPADFNEKMEELYLPHELPIAIYSFVKTKDDRRLGAFYPFCEYSPEWQALQIAKEQSIPARFIDLPWAQICQIENTGKESTYANRYADPQLRHSRYIAKLCQELGVDDFDALWDELFEIDGVQETKAYKERAYTFCKHSRELGFIDDTCLRRETYMRQEIKKALAEFKGKLLIVTGGFHIPALEQFPNKEEEIPPLDVEEHGVALTPYSYGRLDRLVGYEAGMPGPGFYAQVWQARQDGGKFDHQKIVAQVVTLLRKKGQQINTADLIATESTARSLANLRGHKEIWRQDIIDALRGALVKDEVARGGSHPLLKAVAKVFRGDNRGRLAKGTSVPPLVNDLNNRLKTLGLEATEKRRERELKLHNPHDRACSRLLHCMRLLGIQGYRQIDGAQSSSVIDHVWEQWEIMWLPEFEASAIEASRYGPTVNEAAAAILAERAESIEKDVAKAAAWLVDAALAGIGGAVNNLCIRLNKLIKTSGDFIGTSSALSHLIYLYCYDKVLEFDDPQTLGVLISDTYARCLLLFEGLGLMPGKENDVLEGIRLLVETYERCHEKLELSRDALIGTMSRVEDDQQQSPQIRGGAVGALWTMQERDADALLSDLKLFADPDKLGDFLTGLFCLARQTVQREEALLDMLDSMLAEFNDDEFIEALPSLRLAFTFFTPREKHHLALGLLETARQALGLSAEDPDTQPLPKLLVSPEEAQQAMLFETRLFETLNRHGIRPFLRSKR